MSVMTKDLVASSRSWDFRAGNHSGRIGDLIMAGALFLFALPLMASVALAIKLTSRGPVFSRYHRVGRDGRPITVLQFRTTMHNARRIKPCMCWDKPITRVGRLLCCTRVNTLPQLVNVLRGEMTLIGIEQERPDFLSCR
jgi:lipopolysaccharide/colanic/teichoic acid biosynthesis glycosyltransferase